MKKNSSTRVLLVLSAFVLAYSVGLLWLVVSRENQRRNLVLEYEAFRASSAVVDEFRRDPTFIPTADQKVLAFGFYAMDGSSIKTFGEAPLSIDVAALSRAARSNKGGGGLPGNVSISFPADGKSIRLIRASGMGGPGRMQGGVMGPGMGMGRQGQGFFRPLGEPSHPEGLTSSLSVSYYTWIEYSAKGYGIERLEFFLVAAFISFALVGLYVLLLRSFRRNEILKAREVETRELIQLGEAARTLVHEIKNPLGIMRIQTARIRREVREGPITDSAEVIEGEIMRLSRLADRIRDFLKSGQARLEILNLGLFLEKFIQRYNDLGDSGIALDLELPADTEAKVEVDSDKLLMALDNLVRNAIEAVEKMPESARHIGLRLYSDEKAWKIAVEDSGEGIEPEVAARIFDPFFTTKEKGSGIGLPLARNLVEACGGSLVYRGGKKGEGAVFILSLKAR